MARLEYIISGDNSSLVTAVKGSIANIENLTNSINEANVSMQFKNGIAALDSLGQKLLVVQGNATLFGDSIKNQTERISAYQSAINSLLANGYSPMSDDVQRLKTQVDALNESIKATPQRPQSTRDFVDSPGYGPGTQLITSNPDVKMAGVQELNQLLAQGTITAQEYAQALASANTTAQTLSESTQQTSANVEAEIGYIQQLKNNLAEINLIRLNAPQEQLAELNFNIQETEILLKQATNVGKVGFDSMGNSIRGVSLQNVNGQLIALSNNLFGARQIAKDVVRTLDAGSLSGFTKGLGLLAVDFLYYAQNARFAAGATTVATGAIAAEGTVAATAGLSTAALGAAFASLLTPVNLVILGVAVLGGGFLAYEKSQKKATQSATEHLKALREQKQALDDVISTLNAQQQVQAEAADGIAKNTEELNRLINAIDISKGSLQDETKAFEDLKGTFPEYFANIQQSQIGTQAFADAVKNASDGLKDLALANAAFKLGSQSAVDVIKNTVARDNAVEKALDVYKQLQVAREKFKNAPSVSGGEGGSSGVGEAQILAGLETAYADANKEVYKYANALNSASDQQDKFNKIAKGFQDKNAKTELPDNRIGFLKNEIADLEKILPKAQNYQDVLAKIKADQAELDTLLGKNSTNLLNQKAKELSILQQIAAVLAESNADVTKSGLTGYSLQVAEITTQYQKYGVELDNIAAKIKYNEELYKTSNHKSGSSPKQVAKDTESLDAARGILSDNQITQLNDAKIKAAQDTANAIQKINNDFGIKEQTGYNQDLARIKKLYDDTIAANQAKADSLAQIDARYEAAKVKAGKNQSALDAAKANYDAQILDAKNAQAKIDAAKADFLPAIQAADEKYIQIEQQTYDKILDIANQAFSTLDDGETRRTDKINAEWEKRRNSANTYFDKLRELAKTSIDNPGDRQTAVDNISQVQAKINLVLDDAKLKQVSEEISKNFASAMQSAVQGFVSNFYTSITSLGATRQSIDEKYAQQIQQQQEAYTESKLAQDGKISQAQNDAAIAQINRIKELEKQTTTSFTAIFGDLVGKFNSSFNQSILQGFTKQLTENLGKNLLTPTAAQLTISPEEKAALNVSNLLDAAGKSLANQIEQAGINFYHKSVTGGNDSLSLLSGASGGSSSVPGLTAYPGLGSFAPDPDGTVRFGNSVEDAASNFKDAATKAGGAVGLGAETGGKAIANAGEQLKTKVANAAAALSVAGSLISGAVSPTSEVGQGIGGALSGAGAGALIGTALGGPVLGTAIGAAVGFLGGIFSANKAQKAIQEQQLAEQKTMAATLKSQLAYTSNIIGRDTAYGVVTSISVGATGEIKATLGGRDMILTQYRNANVR